ncbi:enoyl-CoA hydratase/isomerase family protein [Streptomyces sp. URMC 126]|uniref:enoyl-CoA hydratase/isomerase family protein n=1 Tax=Streptomyces sp. URMC 126 TaxID=3423401 RepID=UPI003F1CD53B
MLMSDIERWRRAAPVLAGAPGPDGTALERHTGAADALLAALPSPPERNGEQRGIARTVHHDCHRLRARFLDLHAERVHQDLTDDGRTPPTDLEDLADTAARRFPGLVPVRERLAEEQALPLEHKEGLEIAHGVLFRALLRSPRGGPWLLDAALRPTARAKALLPRFRRTGFLDLETVTIERRDSVAHVTATRTHCLNAENSACVEAMETAVDLALLDDDVRVGLLRGAPMTHPRYLGRRVFSAGIDLKDLHRGRISLLPFFLRRELGYVHKLMRGIVTDGRTAGPDTPPGTGRSSLPDRAFPDRARPERVRPEGVWPEGAVAKPWVAVVDAFAIGGGAQILPLFDYVLAGADSYLSLPAAQEGIVPGASNLRLGRKAGSRLARQLILHGRRIQAREDDAKTFFDEVVEPCELDAAAARAVARLDDRAVAANRRMLSLAEEPVDAFREYMAEYALEQALRLHSEDVAVRVARFGDRGSRRDRDRDSTTAAGSTEGRDPGILESA